MNFRVGLILAGSLLVGAAGCAAGGGSTGAETAPRLEGEELAQGERPRRNEMTEAAADALEEAQEIIADAEEAGTDVSAARDQARTHYRTALQAAEQAIAADSTNPLPWYQAGIASIGIGDYVEADRFLGRAEELRPVYTLEIEPRRERAWIALFNEAQPELNAGNYEEAARIFEQADAIYSARPEVKIVLGQIYSSLGRNDEAADMFREALDIIEDADMMEVDSATALQWEEHQATLPLAIADALIAAEEYDEAAGQLRMLIEEDPENVVLSRNLASVFIRLNQPDSAAVIYEELLARPNLTGSDYYQIGVGLYNMEDWTAAADAFSNAVDAAPRHRDAAEMRARSIQLAFGELPEGQEPSAAQLEALGEAAEGWLELDPYSRNAHLVSAQAANRLGNEDRARELVQAIEALPIVVDNLQIRHQPGGATVLGQVINMTQPAGTDVTVEFTFYGPQGQSIGTASADVQLPAQEAAQPLRVDFESEERIAGYSYTVSGLQQ